MKNGAKATSAARTGVSGSSKAEDLAHRIRADIATGLLKPGTMLPAESELFQRYSVSRPSYREAIRLLESEGLLEVRRGVGGGTRVLVPSLEPLARNVAVILQARDIKLESLFAARLLYEPEIVAQLARHRDDLLVAQLAKIVAAQEFATHSRVDFGEYERAFRRALVENSDNPVLRLIGLLIDDVFTMHLANRSGALPPLDFENAHLTQGVQTKQRLIKAIAAGDAADARRVWRAYIAKYSRRVTKALGAHSTILAYRETAA